MMGRYDGNPFADDEDINPFSSPKGVHSNSNSRLEPLPPEPADYDRSATIDIPLHDPNMDMKKKMKELQDKEVELIKREQELKRREDSIARVGVVMEEKNWPSFFPLIHLDIPNEIPIHLQKLQYVALNTYIGLIVCLTWNVIAVTIAWIKGEGAKVWLLAVIYLMFGVPGGYMLWFGPLYRAMRTDSALQFGMFFLVYSVHIGFCILATIGSSFVFEEKSLTGIFATMDVFSMSTLAGLFYLIGFALFFSETLVSIWVIQQIYMYFRGSGMAAEMKRQAGQTMMVAL